MKLNLSRRRVTAAAACLAIAALALPSRQAGAASPTAQSQFLTFNTTKHTATLKLTAGLTADNHTLNFNGYVSGGMVVSVPKGYRVKVLFTNMSTFPHSAVFTLFADKSSGGIHPLAFPGASSPSPIAGTPPNGTATFSFKASKVGTYAIICEVGHHSDAGMWDLFKVTLAKKPSIKLTAPAATPSPTPTSYNYIRNPGPTSLRPRG